MSLRFGAFMRRLSLAIPLSLLMACTPGSSTFDHQAELSVDARGVALSSDGARGQVGMFGTTCAVDTQTATVGADVDVDESEEMVHDAGTVDGRDVVIMSTDDGIYSVDSSDVLEAPRLELSGSFFDARTFDHGLVGLGGQALVWSTGGEVPVGAVADFDLDSDGVAYVADGDVQAISPEGTAWLGAGDRVALDRQSGLVFMGYAGDTELRMASTDGDELGSVALEGGLRQVVSLGDRAGVVVVTSRENGTGQLVVVDAAGSITGAVTTPSPALDVSASQDGETIAAKVPGAIHFFAVR
jgi:hypothetical protein